MNECWTAFFVRGFNIFGDNRSCLLSVKHFNMFDFTIISAGEGRDPRHERMDQVTAGIARCSRALAILYPSLSVEQAVERCAEDRRLRLRTIKVCRRCANEIVRASGEACLLLVEKKIVEIYTAGCTF